MTSKERVLTTFANREADRVPIINSNGFLRGMEQTLVDLITEDPAGMLLARRRTEINQYGRLTDRDLAELLPAIVKAVRKLAPSNEMFGDGIRLAGLDLLSRHHIAEGMPLCVEVIEPDRWGQGSRIAPCLEYLRRYGGNARGLLPELQKLREALGL